MERQRFAGFGLTIAGLLLVVALAGCEADGAAYGTSFGGGKVNRIVGGAPEAGYPAVGALTQYGDAFCTGTLVGPDTVVTAAHCVGGDQSGVAFFLGSNVHGAGTSIPVTSMAAHPNYDGQQLLNDIAVVKLSQRAAVTPVALQTEPMGVEWRGRRAIFVGFGITHAGGMDHGAKRSVTIPIQQVDATEFRYAEDGVNTCNGDSGGPALLESGGVMRLIGVTSYGDEGCTIYGANTRVDPYVSFIESYMGGTPPAPTPAPSGGTDFCEARALYDDGRCDTACPQNDPDCDTGGTGGGSEGTAFDFCAEWGWYGDGECDAVCPKTDQDCGTGGGTNPTGGGEDECQTNGWYGDGKCDEFCPQADPDCQGGGGGGDGHDSDCQAAAAQADGTCDQRCADADPDCGGIGAGLFSCRASSAPAPGGILATVLFLLGVALLFARRRTSNLS